MSTTEVLLQEYAHAVRVAARRVHVFSQPAGSVADLVEFNRELEKRIDTHLFCSNEIRTSGARHRVQSPRRNAINERVPISWAEGAACRVLGGDVNLPVVGLNGVETVPLDAKIIQHICPNTDLGVFETLANVCSAVRAIDCDATAKGSEFSKSQADALKAEYQKLKLCIKPILNVLGHKVIPQLTNTHSEQKELKAVLKRIQQQGPIKSLDMARQFIKDINSIYAQTGKILAMDLLQVTRQKKLAAQGNLFDVPLTA